MQNLPIEPEHIERYNNYPWWAQLLVRYESIRTTWLPLTPLIAMTALGAPWWIGGALSVGYVVAALRFVKPKMKANRGANEEEPQFGMLEVLKLRLPIVFDEGFCLTIPFISRLILRSKEQWNETLTVKSVGCRLEPMKLPGRKKNRSFFEAVTGAFKVDAPADIQIGGKVTVEIGVTIVIDYQDPWVILEFDEAGEKPGVLEIMKDQVDQDVREMGRVMTWLQMKFAGDLMSAHIIASLAKTSDGIDKTIFDSPTTTSIQEFLLKVRSNGVSYLQGLGIKIKRMQITAVVGEGKLEEEAEKASVELLRTQGLIRNTQGIVEAVGIMKATMKDGSLTDKAALDAILVNDPDARVSREIKDHNLNAVGIEQAINGVAKLAMRMMNKTGAKP